jgi:putative endonuclease
MAGGSVSWFLYVLECQDGSLYTGITVDVEKRFAVHKAGKGAKYTRSHPPQRVLAVQAHADRSSALKAEHGLKKLCVAQKRAFCERYIFADAAAENE